ncbi:uncharacterized protein LOC115629466 [Scaptodrosophila lebanonensis]|uniref:Uncharacterized protein LOC115629466 n=1 Tax=Drosophila lebanonensis TaxID=7225 RepID=A0A6J2U1M6_DROLE|nr:uncharacterized protein LOC115629466 [Scaptodrosophila lebanonensis]XP_030381796.1 uncharacterized protein LOC115629466 [Scaptodrosophila lebanonensis]
MAVPSMEIPSKLLDEEDFDAHDETDEQLVSLLEAGHQLPAILHEDSSMESPLEQGMSELQRIFEQLVPNKQTGRSSLARSPHYFFGTLIEEPSAEDKVIGHVSELEEDQLPQPELDDQTRFKAAKFFNLMLTKLWRRRRSEVFDLHALVRRYQELAFKTQNELFKRNQLICMEHRRGENLRVQLVRAVGRVRVTSKTCRIIEEQLMQLRAYEKDLQAKLQEKTQECDNFSELLQSCKTELFRELAKYRQTSSELAQEQRNAQNLEIINTELEDELLTLKDRFQTQNDKMTVELTRKQEQLDSAYELLKDFEEEVAELELEHTELMRSRENERALQKEIAALKKEMGMVRYVFFYRTVRRLSDLPRYISELFATILSCLFPQPSISSVRFCIALLILIAAMN